MLAFDGITKRFGSLTAVDAVSCAVAAGEVHAILGENGAGKSTLMHVAYGMLRPDAGTITVRKRDGSEISCSGFRSPAEARAAGIGMVHQHFSSIDALSVGENIALSAGWRETGRRAERRAEEVIARIGLPVDARPLAGTLSVQLRQRLEIVKALASDAAILLLDEPTAVLAPREIAELLRFLRRFAAGGGAVALITHKLAEVISVADRVTVLRRGVVTLADDVSGQTPRSLAAAMIGGEIATVEHAPAHPPGQVLVRAERLRIDVTHAATRPGTDFIIRAGEIVAVAAVEGNGQHEWLRALAGLDRHALHGTLEVHGPVGFIPADRIGEGLIPSMTLDENLLLGRLDDSAWWLDWRALREETRRVLAEYDIRAPDPSVRAAALSGGNQQKLVVGRVLVRMPRVIVADNPTRGLDVQSAAAIHHHLRRAAANGAAVIVYSADLDEVQALGDRIFVVSKGQVSEMPADVSRDTIGDAMLGVVAA